MPISLIVGLGNPGAEYATSRHNAGFWLVDAIAREAGGVLRAAPRFHGATAQVQFDHQKIALLQPHTFMNRSGLSIKAFTHFHQIRPDEILIVHDALEFSPGTARLKFGGGSGGHNGLKDVSAQLLTPQYWRLRIGIGHPRDQSTHTPPFNLADFVLSAPSHQEKSLITCAINASLSVIPLMIAGETERALTQLHIAKRIMKNDS
jgi:peptidyl-tRNA hydrolase, PTH1 family